MFSYFQGYPQANDRRFPPTGYKRKKKKKRRNHINLTEHQLFVKNYIINLIYANHLFYSTSPYIIIRTICR